jgi:FixJ family two-component response regulator
MRSGSEPVRRPLVLLIEDDDAVRRALHLLLVSHGYEVLAFPCARGVAAQGEAMRAACLVADLLIPEGDGLSLLQDLRLAGWQGPAILISGHLTDELAARAVAQGYEVVLPKPIGESILVGAIARLLEARRTGVATA